MSPSSSASQADSLPIPSSYASAALLSGAQYSQAQGDAKCAEAWQYFKSQLLLDNGAVLHTDTNAVVSEGQSYGMMLAVQNNDQEAFDKIWNFTKTYMQAGNKYGLFGWKASADGKVIDASPAPDADVMIATALFFASKRWGDGAYPYDYSNQAQEISSHILQYEVAADNVLAFAPDNKSMFSPSYQMPAFYRVLAVYNEGGNSNSRLQWEKMADNSYDLIFACLKSEYGNLQNGLVPDHCNRDGSKRDTGQHFYYDAVRTPFFAALDQVWFASDTRSKEYCDMVASFFGPIYASFGDKYELSGTQVSGNHAVSWVGALAGGAMGSSYNTHKANFFNHLMSRSFSTGQYRYYDICWQNFGLLLTTGNFRIYN